MLGELLTAIVTPFRADGSVDLDAFRALASYLVEHGSDGIVVAGTTGESPTLSDDEKLALFEVAVDELRGRATVVAGTGTYDTAHSVQLTEQAHEVGVDGILVVTPYYNKPPQRGIVAHFRAIAEATDLPVIVYNVPGRTGSNIEAKTTLALADVPNIVAVKEASGNLGQITDIIRERPDGFSVLSGDDELTLAVMAAGGEGVISVVSNACPRAMAQLVECAAAGQLPEARDIHLRLLPWMRAAFVESNPVPVKAAMAMMGRIENVLRLPLVPLAAQHDATIRSALIAAGAIA
jgi:4-hydroxy-tetrahydrodipicolinate synthase